MTTRTSKHGGGGFFPKRRVNWPNWIRLDNYISNKPLSSESSKTDLVAARGWKGGPRHQVDTWGGGGSISKWFYGAGGNNPSQIPNLRSVGEYENFTNLSTFPNRRSHMLSTHFAQVVRILRFFPGGLVFRRITESRFIIFWISAPYFTISAMVAEQWGLLFQSLSSAYV